MAYNANANKHLAYRYGYCVNDKCEKSQRDAKGNHIVQQVASHKPFICENCGKALHECPPPKESKVNGKLIGIIAAAAVILGGGGFGLYKALSGADGGDVPPEGGGVTGPDTTVVVPPVEEPVTAQPVLVESIVFTSQQLALTVDETSVLSPVVNPAENEESLLFASSDDKVASVDSTGTVKGIKAGTAIITVTASKSAKQASVEVTVKGKGPGPDNGNTSGTVNLGFGTYDGPRKNFKADGFGGEIRFTRSYTIDLKKASGETVEVGPGDVMVNVKMKDNRIIQGLLKRVDGSQRMIIIG